MYQSVQLETFMTSRARDKSRTVSKRGGRISSDIQ